MKRFLSKLGLRREVPRADSDVDKDIFYASDKEQDTKEREVPRAPSPLQPCEVIADRENWRMLRSMDRDSVDFDLDRPTFFMK